MSARAFSSVLVANRGEIAARVLREARRAGLAAVAVYSDADEGAIQTREADTAVRIGPAPAAQSYLNAQAILDAAKRTGAEAVHPGYGFLSENAGFARAVEAAGLVWIGPPASAIEAMGDKARAKALMDKAGVPTVPGWRGDDQSPDNLASEAEGVGFPLLIKAAAGGGGRGMRVVREACDFADALASAKREAKSSFGDESVLLERFIARGRHVEIQVFADAHGNVIHLGERDCSAQRRRQKVIEEAPSPALDAELRARMGADAVAAAKAVGYVGAGTVEFLLDETGAYFFLEMNTRLQVEHPVTEEITGLNLVQLQFDVAAGARLPLTQDEVTLDGWAIEARLYAEDPLNGFAPQSGDVAAFMLGADEIPGVRIDEGVHAGDVIGTDYDAMVAKFIAHGPDRDTAIERLLRGLEAGPLMGVKTNRDFLMALIDGEAFRSGRITTGDLDAWAEAGSGPFEVRPVPIEHLALAGAIMAGPREGALRSGSVSTFDLPLEADGERVETRLRQTGARTIALTRGDDTVSAELLDQFGAEVRWRLDGVETEAVAGWRGGVLHVAYKDRIVQIREASPWGPDAAADPSKITAPVSGAVVALNVKPGDAVKAGDVLAVMEAMKMEMRLTAEADGVVSAVNASENAQAASGSVLIELDLKGQD